MDGIFISYRREDSSGYAGRLYDRLAARFGREHVFMDVEGIDPGTDFIDAIDSAVASCTVLLVLIGPKWLGEDIGNDKRRIDDPHDFVRLETAAALRRKIRVLPVLVNDADMPGEDALPPDLKALARRQAIEINHKQWDASTGEVLKALDRIFGTDKPSWRLPAIIAASGIALAIGGTLLWMNRPADDTMHSPPPTLTAAPATPATGTTTKEPTPVTPSPTTAGAEKPLPSNTPTPEMSVATVVEPAAVTTPAAKPQPVPRTSNQATTTKPSLPARPQAEPTPSPTKPAPRPEVRAEPKPEVSRALPAPSAMAGRTPQTGEKWIYRTRGRWATSPKRTVNVIVDTVQGNTVTERMEETAPAAGPSGARTRWTGGEAQIVHDGGLGSEFSPFIGSFVELHADKSWRSVPTPDMAGNWGGWFSTAEVLKQENVSVPAGQFNAWKVEVWASRHMTGTRASAALEPVRIHFMIWYAAEQKRYVRMERKLIAADGGAMEIDTIELVSGSR